MMGTTLDDSKASGGLMMTPRVPHGLAAAVEGLTREVIRHRPEDIYVFAAQHFEQLLKLRDQYGAVSNLPGKSTNTATLREMNQAIKKREGGREKQSRREVAEQGGWSLNETARILEKHRSIFGENGRKISTEEVRALAANEKRNKLNREARSSDRAKSKENLRKFESHKKSKSSERFVKRSEGKEQKSKNDSTSVKVDSNGTPKIISQIPTLTGSTTMLAKDIKSELRKNRISSKDRRSIQEKVEKKTAESIDSMELSAKKTGTIRKSAARKSYRERSLEKFLEREKRTELEHKTESIATDNQKHKTDINGFSKSLEKIPRGLSMDRVKDYVVQRFKTSESLEELQSTNYVDKVQRVIDESAPVIKEKIQELKMGMERLRSGGRRSRNGYDSVDESTSTSGRSDKSNQTDDIRSRSAVSRSRKSRRTHSKSRSKKSTSESKRNDSLDGIETLASETETPKEVGEDNLETKLNETQNLLRDISTAFSASGGRERARRARSAKGVKKHRSISTESDVSDYLDIPKSPHNLSNVSLPAVKPPSSRNASRSVSRSDSDNLVLPRIPPEAPKSAKQREELVLPVLSPPGSIPSTAGSKAPLTPDIIELVKTSGDPETPDIDGVLLEDVAEAELNLPDVPTEEVFKDSLNVTPDIIDIPQRPDSLEPEGVIDVDKECGNEIDKVKTKLIEIETVEKNIEKLFGSETQNERKMTENISMKDKLQEIEETEKRIEEILGSESHTIQENIILNDDLQEIECVDERIEEAFDPEVRKTEECLSTDIIKTKLKEIQNAEERIQKIFDSGCQQTEEIGDNTISIHISEDTAAPHGTPDIPEPSFTSEVDPKHEVDIIEYPLNEPDKHMEICQTKETPVETDGKDDDRSENIDKANENNEECEIGTDIQDGKDNIDKLGSTSPESLPYSYILTEGSPYDIPDSVTTVIIPERPDESLTCELMESVHEDDVEVRPMPTSALQEEVVDEKTSQRESSSEGIINLVPEDVDHGSTPEMEEPVVDFPEDSESEPLRNILDSFGEIVLQDINVEGSTVDVDFIRGIKTSHDVLVPHQDLDQIVEEADKELEESQKLEVVDEKLDVAGSPALENIEEKDENGEISDEDNRKDSLENDHRGGTEEGELGTDGEVEDQDVPPDDPVATENVDQNSDSDERLKQTTTDEVSDLNVDSPPDIATTTDLQNTSDSESSGEVKETSITDGVVENTAPELSGNSPEDGESSEARVTESTNEVKETTITDHLDIGSASYNLVNQSMPRVPELNLDSLQDITVSSFQITEDEAEGKENGEPSQQESERTASLMDALTSDEVKEEKNNPDDSHEEIVEEAIVKDRVEIKEEPCEMVASYVTGPGPLLQEDELEKSDVKEENEVSLEAKTVTDVLSEGKELEFAAEPIDQTNSESMEKTENVSSNSNDGGDLRSNEIVNLEVAEIDAKDPTVQEVSENDTNANLRPSEIAPEQEVKENLLSMDREVEKTKEGIESDLTPPEAEVVTNDLDDDEAAGERKQYHIYVPEAAGSEESTTTESSTFNSAATKIQAGVRGFLTRRRLQSAQRRSSTLDSVPSIQDSFATDSAHLSPIEEVGLANAATTIQSNYRGYKARQRLRREDAVQKTTLSMENAFEGSGLQHTGEFHDCLPLPLFDYREKIPSMNKTQERGDNDSMEKTVESKPQHDENANAANPETDCEKKSSDGLQEDVPEGKSKELSAIGIPSKNETIENEQSRAEIANSIVDTRFENEQETGNSLFTGSSKDKKSIEMERNDSSLEDANDGKPKVSPGFEECNPEIESCCQNQESKVGVITNNDLALQSQYLNFITSVEEVADDTVSFQQYSLNALDTLPSLKSNVGIESLPLDNPNNDLSIESISLREPLAIPGTPKGVEIEELLKTDEESSATKTPVPYFYPATPETDGASMESAGTKSLGLQGESLDLPGLSLEGQNDAESDRESMQGSPVSFDDENAFLENSPISLDDPTTPDSSSKPNETSGNSKARGNIIEHSDMEDGPKDADIEEEQQTSTEGQKPPPLVDLESEFLASSEDRIAEEKELSLLPDASLMTMSFSMNVDDMLGLGAESELPPSIKPILEVTVTPRDLLKLANRSQGSQMSEDRIDSPVTMMQIVPKSVEEKSDEERATEITYSHRDVSPEHCDESVRETVEETTRNGPPTEGCPTDHLSNTDSDGNPDPNDTANRNDNSDPQEPDVPGIPRQIPKEDKIEEIKEQASPKENESNSPRALSVAESEEVQSSDRTSRTYSVDKESARTYSVEGESPQPEAVAEAKEKKKEGDHGSNGSIPQAISVSYS